VFGVLFVGSLFLYHWVLRRPLEPHNHVADLGLLDFLVVTTAVWLGHVRRDRLSHAAGVVATLGSVVALSYVLFQIDYMLCRQAWLPCAGTGPGISGYLAAFVVLALVVCVRDLIYGWTASTPWPQAMRAPLWFAIVLGLVYVAYRVAMPAEPRHRLGFDLVFLVLVLGATIWYAVFDVRASRTAGGS